MTGANGFYGRLATGETCGIAIMAKASAPGRTKTRLVPPLTFDEAAAINPAGHRRQRPARGPARRHRRLRGFCATRLGRFFFAHSPADDRLDRCLPAEFRRLFVTYR
jgi:hypothetical protein